MAKLALSILVCSVLCASFRAAPYEGTQFRTYAIGHTQQQNCSFPPRFLFSDLNNPEYMSCVESKGGQFTHDLCEKIRNLSNDVCKITNESLRASENEVVLAGLADTKKKVGTFLPKVAEICKSPEFQFLARSQSPQTICTDECSKPESFFICDLYYTMDKVENLKFKGIKDFRELDKYTTTVKGHAYPPLGTIIDSQAAFHPCVDRGSADDNTKLLCAAALNVSAVISDKGLPDFDVMQFIRRTVNASWSPCGMFPTLPLLRSETFDQLANLTQCTSICADSRMKICKAVYLGIEKIAGLDNTDTSINSPKAAVSVDSKNDVADNKLGPMSGSAAHTGVNDGDSAGSGTKVDNQADTGSKIENTVTGDDNTAGTGTSVSDTETKKVDPVTNGGDGNTAGTGTNTTDTGTNGGNENTADNGTNTAGTGTNDETINKAGAGINTAGTGPNAGTENSAGTGTNTAGTGTNGGTENKAGTATDTAGTGTNGGTENTAGTGTNTAGTGTNGGTENSAGTGTKTVGTEINGGTDNTAGAGANTAGTGTNGGKGNAADTGTNTADSQSGTNGLTENKAGTGANTADSQSGTNGLTENKAGTGPNTADNGASSGTGSANTAGTETATGNNNAAGTGSGSGTENGKPETGTGSTSGNDNTAGIGTAGTAGLGNDNTAEMKFGSMCNPEKDEQCINGATCQKDGDLYRCLCPLGYDFNDVDGCDRYDTTTSDDFVDGYNPPPMKDQLDKGTDTSIDKDKGVDLKQDDKEPLRKIRYNDDEDKSGIGFISYFLVFTVLVVAGYLVFHNKQKIIALVVEGKGAGRNGRRPSSKEYRQLKTEDVMPSLEKTATSKNYVF